MTDYIGARKPESVTGANATVYRLFHRPTNLAVVRIVGICTLVVISSVCLVVLVWAWVDDNAGSGLRFEAGKTAMQILAVAVLGGLATLAVSAIQKQGVEEAKIRDRRLEEWSREGDHLHLLAEKTILAYNRVKKARRLLIADTDQHVCGRIEFAEYK